MDSRVAKWITELEEEVEISLTKPVLERQQARIDAMNQQGQWQVAGSAPEVYERELVPAVFRPWAPILTELAQPHPGERVVDIACGTGVVARIAAAKVGPTGIVAAVDLNPGMLAVARSLGTADNAAAIDWHEASADKLPLPDGSFDIAYCQLGLQFFADRPAALREMRRVLSSKGRLALMVWCAISESPGFDSFARMLKRNVSLAAATMMRAPFGLADADELRQLVTEADFREIRVQQRIGTVHFSSASTSCRVMSVARHSPPRWRKRAMRLEND